MGRVKLVDICCNKGEYGGAFSATEFFEGAPRYIRITDFADEGGLKPERKAPSGNWDEWKKYLVKQDDLLFARSGSVGKCLLFDDSMGECVFAGYLIRFRPDKTRVFPKYLYFYTKSADYWRWVDSKMNVVAQPNINAKQYGYELEIPLPPLSEQKRIASLLDTADALRQQNKALIAQYNQLAQSLFLEMFGDPVRNEKGWEVKTLGEVVTFIGGGTPSRAIPEYYSGTICWATSKDIKNQYLTKTEEHISETAIERSATNIIREGSIIVVTKSKILMHTLPVCINKVPTCINQDLKAILPSQATNSLYILYLLKLGQRVLLSQARGANTEGLTLSHLKNFNCPLPPLPLQEKFASLIENIEGQKSAAESALRESEALFQRLLQDSFS